MQYTNTSPHWLRPAVEYGPIIVFLASYYFGGLFVATAAIMAATAVALVVSYVIERKLPMIPLFTALIVGIFGGLTLWLQDETFIKMKPTIIQTLFAMILAFGLLTKRFFLKNVMGNVWNMQDQGWRILTLRFIGFFIVMALLNEAVWRTQTTDFWVTFKAFGLMGLTMAFMISQMGLLKKFAIEDKADSDADTE